MKRSTPLSLLAIGAGLAVAALAAAGCEGTETGNPFQVELRADAHSSDPAAVAVGEGGAVSVTEAWLALDPIEMAAAGDCGAAEVSTADFGTADHAAAGAVLEELEVDEGDYCRALLPFVRASAPLPDGAPPELDGSSIVIAGEVVASGTPFLLVSRLERTVDVHALGAIGGRFALAADQPALFLGFDVATWFASVDLASAELDGDGVAVIDDSTNPGLLSAFEADLPAGIELYRDLDRDGSVDPPNDELLARGQ